jgi:hypothetical protein
VRPLRQDPYDTHHHSRNLKIKDLVNPKLHLQDDYRRTLEASTKMSWIETGTAVLHATRTARLPLRAGV